MTTIMPQSELIKRAMEYIIDEKSQNNAQSIAQLIDNASMRFNLSPVESQTLLRLLTEETTTPA